MNKQFETKSKNNQSICEYVLSFFRLASAPTDEDKIR